MIQWKTTMLLTALALAACGSKATEDVAPATAAPAAEQVAPAAEVPAMDATGAPAPEGPVASRDSVNTSAESSPGAVPDGTRVRIESAYLDAGWLEGRVGPSPGGCRMVFLDKPTEGGYTSVALMTLKRLERKHGSEWRDVTVHSLLDREPSHCLEAAAD
jgi:hypothetical protein